MSKINRKYLRVLALAPSTRGFGFAVHEGQDALVDWGIKYVTRKRKNAVSLAKVAGLIDHYNPGIIVLEDTSAKNSRRSPRIRALSQKIVALAGRRKVMVKLFSQKQVRQVFFTDRAATKHDVAEIVADRLPEELGFLLPPERLFYESEDARMDIFDAVALCLTFRMQKP